MLLKKGILPFTNRGMKIINVSDLIVQCHSLRSNLIPETQIGASSGKLIFLWLILPYYMYEFQWIIKQLAT